MKKWKKGMSAMMTATLIAGLMAGCGAGDDSSSQVASGSTSGGSSPSAAAGDAGSSSEASGWEGGLSDEAGTFPLTEEKKELTVMIQDSATIGPLDQNEFYKWYEEKTNVHVNFIEVEAAAMVEQVNLMLMGGEYPDILMCCGSSLGVTPALEVTYGAQGVFLPLNDYIEKWGKETQEVFSLYEDKLPAAITAPDGNIYSLPNINDCYHCNNTGKIWINQTWLDKLKLNTPTTTEEFRDVLRAFKEQDPNGNGVADEIPLMGAKGFGNNNPILFLLNSFLYCPSDASTLYLDDDGKVTCAATQPEFKEGLAYIKSLVDEGLLDASSFTQTVDQLKQFAQEPDAIRLGAYPGTNPTNITGSYDGTPDQRTKNYVPLAPLTGPEGYRNTPVTGQAYYSGFFIITSACEDPELAFRWADGLYSEEATLNSQIGLIDSGRVEVAEGDKGINGEQALWDNYPGKQTGPDNTFRAQNVTLARRTSDFRLGQRVDYSDSDYQIRNNEVRLYEATRDYYAPYCHTENYLPNAYLTEEESAEVAQLTETLSSYVEEQSTLFILGTRDLDTEWDSYLKEFDSMNLNRLIEIRQAAYDRQFK